MAGSTASMDDDREAANGDKFMYYLDSIQQAFPFYESDLEAADTWGHGPSKQVQGFVAQESYPYQVFRSSQPSWEQQGWRPYQSSRSKKVYPAASSPWLLHYKPKVATLHRQAFKPMLFLSGIVKALHNVDCDVIFKDLVCIADEQIETTRTTAEQDIEQPPTVPGS